MFKSGYIYNGGVIMYIHIGSTKQDVRALLGEPSRVDAGFWTYGTSHIKFDHHECVIAWKNMFSEMDKGFMQNRDDNQSFFLGSSMHEVLLALGSPTGVVDSPEPVWEYESSHVKFDKNGFVIEWKNNYKQINHGLDLPIDHHIKLKLGDLKTDVLSALGAPTSVLAIEPNVWHYEASHVKFDEKDCLIEWRNQYHQLDHGMKKQVDEVRFLELGLSEDEVMDILGAPTTVLAINPMIWKYDSSHVLFENHKVVEWKNMFRQLNYGMQKSSSKGVLRVDLTKDEVLNLLGTPDTLSKLNPNVWHYHGSHIMFKDGKVVEWRQMFHDLEVAFAEGEHTATDISIGSSKETVLNRLGSPTAVLEKEPLVWHYGNASIIFGADQKVKSWQNIDDIKKHVL